MDGLQGTNTLPLQGILWKKYPQIVPFEVDPYSRVKKKFEANPMKVIKGFGYFLTTLLMYLVIPLLGWGIMDLEGFFRSGQRLAYALIVVALGIGVAWQSLSTPQGFRGGEGRGETLVPRQRLIRIAVTLFLFFALLFLPFADRHGIGTFPDDPAVRWIGVILIGFGMGLVFWSGVALGKLCSGDVTLQEGHRLITDGPYRLVRHPRYLGGILSGFGLALIFISWIGLIGSVIFIAIILYRIRDEEVLMRENFEKEWDSYCEKTSRLIPFVY